MKAEQIKSERLVEILLDIANDMNDGCVDCSMAVNNIKLPDGRLAQVQIKITTDKSEFTSVNPPT